MPRRHGLARHQARDRTEPGSQCRADAATAGWTAAVQGRDFAQQPFCLRAIRVFQRHAQSHVACLAWNLRAEPAAGVVAEDVTALLQPYMDLMNWDVRAVTELDYEREIGNLRKVARGAT